MQAYLLELTPILIKSFIPTSSVFCPLHWHSLQQPSFFCISCSPQLEHFRIVYQDASPIKVDPPLLSTKTTSHLCFCLHYCGKIRSAWSKVLCRSFSKIIKYSIKEVQEERKRIRKGKAKVLIRWGVGAGGQQEERRREQDRNEKRRVDKERRNNELWKSQMFNWKLVALSWVKELGILNSFIFVSEGAWPSSCVACGGLGISAHPFLLPLAMNSLSLQFSNITIPFSSYTRHHLRTF